MVLVSAPFKYGWQVNSQRNFTSVFHAMTEGCTTPSPTPAKTHFSTPATGMRYLLSICSGAATVAFLAMSMKSCTL